MILRPVHAFAAITVLALAGALALSATALGHGAEEEGVEGGGAVSKEAAGEKGISAEEAEIRALAKQPARILAQQAIAELKVRGDQHEAAVRLDAALESKDQKDIDVATLRKATETLDGGDPNGAIPLLDQALSRPLGAESGKSLHEAGREFAPASSAQEVVGIVSGTVLLALGAFLLLAARRRPAGHA